MVRHISTMYINSNHISKTEIYDMCHKLFPQMEISKIRNYLYDLHTVLPIIAVFCLTYFKNNGQLFYQFSIMLIILNLIRPIFYSITVLPDPTDRCKNNNPIHSEVYEFLVGSCKDMIFSGHISNSFMALLFLIVYFGLPIPYAFLHQVILVIMMLCQRKHYTVDIIIAYLMTLTLFDHRSMIFDFLKV